MTTPLKAIGAMALSTLAIACSSQQNDVIASFSAQCKPISSPAVGETSIQGLTFVGSSIADAPFDTSASFSNHHFQNRCAARYGWFF